MIITVNLFYPCWNFYQEDISCMATFILIIVIIITGAKNKNVDTFFSW